MKGALTLPKVRNLVRLYRADVEGAAEQLETLIREQWDELHPLLGITPDRIVRLLEREDAPQAFSCAVDEAGVQGAAAKTTASRKIARAAAVALAGATVRRDDGQDQLPVKVLRVVLDLWRSNGDIAFGDRGVIDVGRLRALLRQCAGLDSTLVTLTDDHLIITYSTTRARGVIRLVLRARQDHDRVIVVPIPARTVPQASRHAIYAPAPWPADDAQRASSPQPPKPPKRPMLVLVG